LKAITQFGIVLLKLNASVITSQQASRATTEVHYRRVGGSLNLSHELWISSDCLLDMMLESKSVSQAGGGGLDIVQKNPFSLSENLDSDYCNSTKIIIKKRIKKSALKL